ncbi:MAG: hypothetical protein HONBIEJF_00548 [Fimbriimonadaceae bacterium]|nr:hypothetical protein [Fimbriimonadaceae bacterium]
MAQVPLGDYVHVFTDDFNNDRNFDEATANPKILWDTGGHADQPFGEYKAYGRTYPLRYAGQLLVNKIDSTMRPIAPPGGTKGNHTFSGGVLSLWTRKQTTYSYPVWVYPQNPLYSPPAGWQAGTPYTTNLDFDYTSATLFSRARYGYGYYEIRCRIPYDGVAVFPAFWLYAKTPEGGYREIDVFEFPSYPGSPYGLTPNRFITTIHVETATEGGFVPTGTEPADQAWTSLTPGGDPWNNYQGTWTLPSPGVSGAFHTYGVKWTPNSIRLVVDGIERWVLLGHSPHHSMHLIVSTDISEYLQPYQYNATYPYRLEIDYIRAYRLNRREFIHQSGNSGSGSLAGTPISQASQAISAKSPQAIRDYLVTIDKSGAIRASDFAGTTWNLIATGVSQSLLQGFQHYLPFQLTAADIIGDREDELLLLYGARFGLGQAHPRLAVLRRIGPNYTLVGDMGTLPGLSSLVDARILAADFNGDGKDEVLVVTLNQQIMYNWVNGAWVQQYDTSTIKKRLPLMGTMVVGNVDGGASEEIFCIDTLGRSNIYRFAPGEAVNGAWLPLILGDTPTLDGKRLKGTDSISMGDFNGDGRDEVFLLGTDKYSFALGMSGGVVRKIWDNEGSGRIQYWYMDQDDKCVAGKFGSPVARLVLFGDSGWSHVLNYAVPLIP